MRSTTTQTGACRKTNSQHNRRFNRRSGKDQLLVLSTRRKTLAQKLTVCQVYYGEVHPVVIVCLALLFLGAGLAVKWGRLDFVTPPPAVHMSFAEQAKRALWFLDIVMIGGVVGGLLAAGAGGRLAMRLLAATSGDHVQGRITEADEIVGEITVGGTIGFIVFGGLFAGLVCSVFYLLLRKWLPRGLVGALVLGALVLVTLGSRVEPLRSNNPDFDLVTPSWLAVSIFAALAFLHAIVVVAVMARISQSLPLLSARRSVVFAYLPLLILLPTVTFGGVVVAILMIGAALSTLPAVRNVWRDARVLLAGRIVISAAACASLPGFTTSIADIL